MYEERDEYAYAQNLIEKAIENIDKKKYEKAKRKLKRLADLSILQGRF